MKIIFLFGAESPLDLLLFSLFMKNPPACELIVGVQRDTSTIVKTIKKVWKVVNSSGFSFVGFNVFLQTLVKKLIFDDDVVAPNVESIRQRHGFPLFFFDKVNDESTLAIIRKYSPDLILNHMPQRIKLPLIQIPPKGIVNIHPAILPDYQGMGSNLWPLIDGFPYHGASFHYITSEEIDVGPVIAAVRYPIRKGDSVLSLNVNSRIVAAHLINHVIGRFTNNGSVGARPQTGGIYHKLPGKDALKKMKDKGHDYISGDDREILRRNGPDKIEYCDETTCWEWKPWHKI